MPSDVRPIDSPWLTIAEGAAYARCSPKTLLRACASGRLRHARISGRRSIRLRRDWLDDFLISSTEPTEVRSC